MIVYDPLPFIVAVGVVVRLGCPLKIIIEPADGAADDVTFDVST